MLAMAAMAVSWCAAALPPGGITIPTNPAHRVLPVQVTPATTNVLVKLSQHPDFGETSNGVRITIQLLESGLNYADLTITYPDGVIGGQGLPGGLPNSTNEVRVLLVPVRLSGGVAPPSYATNGWFERLMFSHTRGPDARNVPNSAAKFFEQNSYGRVRITGDVFPEWVTVRPARAYTSELVWTIPDLLVHDAAEQIKAARPGFFQGKSYDMIVIVMGGEFVTVYNNYYEQTSSRWDDPDGIFSGYLLIDLPVEANCALLRPITNEVNTVSNAVYVQPALRASQVRGVWLASDPLHAGVNFFEEGTMDFDQNLITLGRPVPAGQSVIVDYDVATFYRQWDPPQPFFSASQVSTWYGTFLHELAHALGPHITFTATRYLGDLYLGSDQIQEYGLMSGGNHNARGGFAPLWSDPACLDGYTKFALGLVQPYELRYGGNEVNLRLYAAEEYPYTERTKLIKVPLHADGHLARHRYWFDYAAEEYLLIELRKKRAVPGIHNFDLALPHEGVVIYHVSEGDRSTIGAFWDNFARIMDATPWLPPSYPLHSSPLSNMRASIGRTAAPFGFDSGKFEYVHGAQWQEIGDSNLLFRLEGRGLITIHAKFGDGLTNESSATSAMLAFEPFADANSNSLDDNWERDYFGSLTSAQGAASADADADGLSNLQEFLAGINPTNASSVVRLSGAFVNGQYRMQVPTVNGRRYSLEYSRDIHRPRWIGFERLGDGFIQETGDWAERGKTRFFRVNIPEQ